MSLENTRLRLDSAPFRVREFVRKNGAMIAERTFGETFRDLSRGRGMTKRYQQSFRINMDFPNLELVLDYKGDNGEPLGVWFEKGTKRHFVAPKEKKALSWIESGDRFFSKGHFVKGIQASYIIRDTIRIGMEKFLADLHSSIGRHLEESRLGRRGN